MLPQQRLRHQRDSCVNASSMPAKLLRPALVGTSLRGSPALRPHSRRLSQPVKSSNGLKAAHQQVAVSQARKDLSHLATESSLSAVPASATVPVNPQPAKAQSLLLQEYATRTAAVFQDCQALEGLGLHAHLDRPTIVIGGDRGCGKSQIVTRLCGVDVPLGRGDGQPGMRCPLMIQLINDGGPTGSQESPAWYQIRLRRTHDAITGEPLSQTLVTPFGVPILDTSELTTAMLRAQATLLNPGRPTSDFLDYLPINADANELLMTCNAVFVEVHNAPMDLVVVDLPGLTPYAEAYGSGLLPEQREAARMMRRATVDYMSMPNAVLIAVISCCTDVAHQEVLDLARRVDAAGRRTLGVLTHACSPSAPAYTLGARELLTGRVMPLRLGYVLLDSLASAGQPCATVKPSSNGRSGSPSSAGSPDVGSALALLVQDAQQANRHGEAVLGHLASGLLLEQLALQMPNIQAQVMDRLAQVDAQLVCLIPSARPEELALHARTQLRAVARAFDDALRGQGTGPGAMQLVQDIMAAYKDFGRRVVSTRPRFQLAVAEVKQRLGSPGSRRQPSGRPADNEPVLARYGEEDEEGDPLFWPGVAVTTVDDVKRLLAAQRGLELPMGDMRDSAATRTIRAFQTNWRRDALTLLDLVAARLLEEMRALTKLYFGAHPRLADVLKGYCVDLVSSTHQRARAQLTMQLDMELASDNPPLTLLDRHFQTLQEVLASSMQGMRAQALSLHQPHMQVEDRATKVEAVRQLLHELGTDTSGWTDQQLLERLGVAAAQEQDGSAIRVMAASMAFFKVSSRRFRDTVPLCVRHHMINALAASFDDHMERCLLALASGAADGPSVGGPASRLLSPPASPSDTSRTSQLPASSVLAPIPTVVVDRRSTSPAPVLSSGEDLQQGGLVLPLTWASSPAVLCLMVGGPLDAVSEVERQELLAARETLASLLKRVTAHLHPHGA